MSKVKCLAFLDNPLGRDTEILLPITYVMERYLQVEVTYLFIWDLFLIRRYQPDIILIPNTRGHPIYVEIAAFAKKHAIKVLALDSEGNFPTDGSFDYWGYNTEKKIYQEWITCWSERTADYTCKLIPEYAKKIKITGGTGFDRYQFSKFPSRNEILVKFKKEAYQKVIGYAGWAFGKLYSVQRDKVFLRFFPENRAYALKWLEEQRCFVRDTLRHLIESNPDILFILKKHPKENFEDEPIEGLNEMNELLEFPNVLYLKNEVPIEQLIYSSDIWMGFETTTLFEAWMLDKPTLILNQETDFPRTEHYKGAFLAKSAFEADQIVKEHFEGNNLRQKYSAEVLNFQKKAIEKAIGFSDGFNHLRAIYHFRKSIPDRHISKKIRFNVRHFRLYMLMHMGRFLFNKSLFMKLPGFRKSIYVFENRGLPGFENRKMQAYSDLKRFYEEKGVESLLQSNNWESLRTRLSITD